MYLGIDPGKDGAFVVLDEDGNLIEKHVMPLIGTSREYDKTSIKRLFTMYEYKHIGIENPSVIFGIHKSAVASLSHCVGMLEGIAVGIGVPHSMIAPKEWQKKMWANVKKVTKTKVSNGKSRKTTDTKATSELAAKNLYPDVDFRKSERSKNSHDGIVDATLIARYVQLSY